jgi:pyruvate/2-oxoglutarate dehydrogenase complex dihydrolipoamide dehydrogenase (E3) component
VTLIEKGAALGGVMRFAEFDADKQDYFTFIKALRLEMEANKVNTVLNCEAHESAIKKYSPDYILIAIGAISKDSGIQGAENAVDVLETYFAPQKIGQKVVMVGSGWSGCEAAIHLAGIGKTVTLIARRDKVAPEVSGMSRTSMLDEMDKHQVKTLTGLQTRRIVKNGVYVADKDGTERFIEADTVVVALGRIPDTQQVEALKTACKDIPYKVIGDSDRVGRVKDAVRSGYIAANLIV